MPKPSPAPDTWLTITGLGAQGDGVADGGDGAPRHVPFTLPGERVRVVPAGKGVRAVEIRDPDPARQAPACPHFTRCGGCRLQHLDPARYADLKRARISTALAQRGVADIPLRPTRGSPPGARRRLDLAIAWEGKAGGRGPVRVGLHEAGSHALVDLRVCPVADPALVALLDPLRDLARTLPGISGARLTRLEDGVDLALEGGPRDLAAREQAAAFADAQDLARFSWSVGRGAQAGWEIVAARKLCRVTIAGVGVAVPPAGFLQATPQGEAAIIAAVAEAVGAPRRVVDLYAGIGTVSLALAAAGAEIWALDGAVPALAAYAGAGRARQLAVRTEQRDLSHRPLPPEDFAGWAAVVLDPPFAGAAAQCRDLGGNLGGLGPSRLAYVSCNPATFARDARTLADGGWRLDWVQPIDQFLWSADIELVAAFSRV